MPDRKQPYRTECPCSCHSIHDDENWRYRAIKHCTCASDYSDLCKRSWADCIDNCIDRVQTTDMTTAAARNTRVRLTASGVVHAARVIGDAVQTDCNKRGAATARATETTDPGTCRYCGYSA